MKTKLPRCLKPFFWEYRFSDLSWEEDRDLVIGRLLQHGDWEAMQWLRRQAGDEQLRAWIEQRQGRGLDRRALRFWELILDIPHRRVNGWLAARAYDTWDRRAVPR